VPSCRSLLLIMAASASTLAATVLPTSTGPAPAHTGGFGEPTCHACHRDNALNEATGVVQLDSLPSVYQPGRVYRLTLSLKHAELARAGFQLSARFEDGSNAGSFRLPDTALLRVQRSRNIDYLSHTVAGTQQVAGRIARWQFEWIAPASQQRVWFHVAANVANNDASEFGDRIFTATLVSGGEAVRK
jgi:hypothetical protein